MKTDFRVIGLDGFGAKGFMLSMIETALRISRARAKSKPEAERVGKYMIRA
jgi:hypothetical protein